MSRVLTSIDAVPIGVAGHNPVGCGLAEVQIHQDVVRRTPRTAKAPRYSSGNPALLALLGHHQRSGRNNMATILWIIAVVLVISGIVTLVRGQVLFGVLLIIGGLLIGPGGVSIFT